MSFAKNLFIIIFIYFLILFQTSFFVHFPIFNIVPNYALILIVLWNLFEDSKKKFGIGLAFLGGFLLDVFSSHFLGFNVLILVATALAIKIIVKKYVRVPFAESA